MTQVTWLNNKDLFGFMHLSALKKAHVCLTQRAYEKKQGELHFFTPQKHYAEFKCETARVK